MEENKKDLVLGYLCDALMPRGFRAIDCERIVSGIEKIINGVTEVKEGPIGKDKVKEVVNMIKSRNGYYFRSAEECAEAIIKYLEDPKDFKESAECDCEPKNDLINPKCTKHHGVSEESVDKLLTPPDPPETRHTPESLNDEINAWVEERCPACVGAGTIHREPNCWQEPKDPIQDNERLKVYRSGYEQGRFDEQIERPDVIQEWMVSKWEEYISEWIDNPLDQPTFGRFMQWLKNNK